MEFDVLTSFLTAVAIGALIGIERQRGQKKGTFAGVRTFVIISFFGALTGFLYQELSYPPLLITAFLSVTVLIAAAYVISALKGYVGITAEVSALVTFFLGFIIMFDDYREYGIVFGVLITILLSVKDVLHKFIDEAKEVEWNDTLKFAIIALVILPLLPEKITLPFFPYGQYYDLNVFYPKEIWLLIVFILGVSFFGYFLIKIIGGKKGANLIGALGGIVSSTAVTQSMAVHSKTFVKKKVGKNLPLISATLLASLMAFARAGLISSSINRDLMPILLPVATVILIGIIMFIFLMRRTESYKTSLKLESPLNIKPAFTLGVLYAILTFLSKLSFATNLGRSGVILGAFVTGLFDIDPVILTVSTLSATSTITSLDAIISIIVAVGANLITKTMIVLSTGSRFFARTMALIFLTFVIILFGWLLYFEPI